MLTADERALEREANGASENDAEEKQWGITRAVGPSLAGAVLGRIFDRARMAATGRTDDDSGSDTDPSGGFQ